MPARFTVTRGVTLEGDIDLEAVLRSVPDGIRMRGMFFSRYAKLIGTSWDDLKKGLEGPPADGTYHAFERYPLGDYLRLYDLAARKLAGDDETSVREAYRELGRGEVDVFRDSTIGRVTMAMVKDPGTLLARYPELISVMSGGALIGFATRKERAVTITFDRFAGAVEQTAGTLEAVIPAEFAGSKIEVTTEGRGATFAASW